MRAVPDLIFAIENLVLKGDPLDSTMFSEEERENYIKIKDIIRSEEPRRYDSRHLKLNNSLKEKLFRLIFNFLPSKSKYTVLQRNVIEIVKKTAVATLIKGLGYPRLSLSVYESVYQKSKKYNHQEGVLESSRALFSGEANNGNIKKAHKYYSNCIHSLKLIENEIQAEWCSAELKSHFIKTKEITKELKDTAAIHFTTLNEIESSFRSRKFLRSLITVGIIHFESEHKYVELCDFLNENIEYTAQHFTDDASLYRLLSLYNLNYLLRIKNFTAFNKTFENLLPTIVSKSNQWFRVHELSMLYHLRTEDYDKCIDVFNRLKKEARFKSINIDKRNRIELNWLYAVISKALIAGKTEAKDILSQVKLGKYLNSIPDFYKDKKGMNISIIIVQLLYYIILKDLDQLDARFEAIEKYLSRYMKSDPLYRSQCFVKMLLQVPKQNFHPVAIERHVDRYFWNLKSMPFLESHHPNEIELTEYEVLWDQIMQYLKGK